MGWSRWPPRPREPSHARQPTQPSLAHPAHARPATSPSEPRPTRPFVSGCLREHHHSTSLSVPSEIRTWRCARAVSYTHLRAHETDSYLVCRLLLEKKKKYQGL